MWGWNGYGQLFLPEEIKIQDSPVKPQILATHEFHDVRCGGWSTMLFSGKGQVIDNLCSSGPTAQFLKTRPAQLFQLPVLQNFKQNTLIEYSKVMRKYHDTLHRIRGVVEMEFVCLI